MWKNTGRPKSGPIYTQYKKTNYYRYIKSVFVKSRLLRPVILPCMTYMNDNWICSELLKQVTASPQQSANNLNKLVRSYGVVLRCAVCRRTCWESEVCAADERCRSSVHQHTASRRDHITPVLLQPRCVRLLKDQILDFRSQLCLISAFFNDVKRRKNIRITPTASIVWSRQKKLTETQNITPIRCKSFPEMFA